MQSVYTSWWGRARWIVLVFFLLSMTVPWEKSFSDLVLKASASTNVEVCLITEWAVTVLPRPSTPRGIQHVSIMSLPIRGWGCLSLRLSVGRSTSRRCLLCVVMPAGRCGRWSSERSARIKCHILVSHSPFLKTSLCPPLPWRPWLQWPPWQPQSC